MKIFYRVLILLCSASLLLSTATAQQNLAALKAEALVGVENRTKLVQEIVDSLFSFS